MKHETNCYGPQISIETENLNVTRAFKIKFFLATAADSGMT